MTGFSTVIKGEDGARGVKRWVGCGLPGFHEGRNYCLQVFGSLTVYHDLHFPQVQPKYDTAIINLL